MSGIRTVGHLLAALAVVAGVTVVAAAPAQAAGSVSASWSTAVTDTGSRSSFNDGAVSFPGPVLNIVRLRIVTAGYGHSHESSGQVVLSVNLLPSGTPVWTAVLEPSQQTPMAIDVIVPGLPATGVEISSDPPQGQTYHDFSISDVVIADFADTPSIPPQCSDGLDNDVDGRTDYPNDAGCTSPSDTTESSDAPQACQSVAGVPVCTTVTTGTVFQSVPVSNVVLGTAATHRVVGTVDVYRLDLPTGGFLTLPCVVAQVNATPVNPCAAAGMTFVSQLASLVDNSVNQPSASLTGTLATVRVCNASVTVTVAGIGLNNFPAFTLC